MLKAIEMAIATAKKELGYLEKATNSQLDSKTANAGYNNWTKYARDLDRLGIYNGPKNGYYWCDVFVDWIFITTFGAQLGLKMINQTKGDCGAGCTYSAQYYKNKGRLFYSNPQPGDQIFFGDRYSGDYEHTGIVTEVKNGYVYTIEGNTSAAEGVIANGGGVAAKCYSLNNSYIGAYGRPNWELYVEPEKEEETMDQTTFQKMYLQMAETWNDNDAQKYSAEAREWAVETGLIAGTGEIKDPTTGKMVPNYAWQTPLTREQFVTVLYRYSMKVEDAIKLGKPLV